MADDTAHTVPDPGGRRDDGVPDWKLERCLLGELPGPERERLDRLIAADPGLRERLEQLRQDGAALLARHPPAWMARQIERRLAGPAAAPSPGRLAAWWPRLAPAAALALVALAALPVLRQTPGPGQPVALDGAPAPPEVTGEVRLKGLEPSLVLHRRTAGSSEELADGAQARPGDRILVQYSAAGRAYGVILSVDGRGGLTQHLPASGTRAAALQPGGRVALGIAYQLDDAPRFERFYFVAGDRPFEVAEVAAAAHRADGGGRLDVPDDLAQFSCQLRKAAQP